MSKKPENPQAFPSPETENFIHCDGMTLRDYFAGQYLTTFRVEEDGLVESIKIAEICYNLADAMLEERSKE